MEEISKDGQILHEHIQEASKNSPGGGNKAHKGRENESGRTECQKGICLDGVEIRWRSTAQLPNVWS